MGRYEQFLYHPHMDQFQNSERYDRICSLLLKTNFVKPHLHFFDVTISAILIFILYLNETEIN